MSKNPSPNVFLRIGCTLAIAWIAQGCGDAEPPAPASTATETSEAAPPLPKPTRKTREEVDASVAPILEVLAEPDPFDRAARLATLLPTLDPSVADHVLLGLLHNAEVELGAAESELLVRFWAEHDAAGAAKWALFHSPTSRRGAAIEIALEKMAFEDPQAAVAEYAASTVVPGPFTNIAQIAVIRGWFRSGKPGLREFLPTLGIGWARQRAVSAYARLLAKRDGVQAAIDWANSVPVDDEAYKKAVLRQTGSAVALIDPLAAAAWCQKVCDDQLGTNLRSMVAWRWAAQDGPAAMEWVSQAPADKERHWAVTGAFRGWWSEDPDGFKRFMEPRKKTGVEPWLQPAIEIFATQLAAEEPEVGLEWAARITDDETRERTYINVARWWRRSDEAAAEAWMASSPLSEEALERVRNPKAFVPGSVVHEPGEEPEAG